MNPKPGADATASRAWRHSSWNLEVRKASPDAGLVHTEHSKILRLNLVHVALVGNGKGTSLEIVGAVRVVCRRWRVGTNVVSLSYITAFRGRKVSGRAFVACNLCRNILARRKFEEVFRTVHVSDMPFTVHENCYDSLRRVV